MAYVIGLGPVAGLWANAGVLTKEAAASAALDWIKVRLARSVDMEASIRLPRRRDRGACVTITNRPSAGSAGVWIGVRARPHTCRVKRNRGAPNRMPSRDPTDERPGVVAAPSELGHGRAAHLKSANAIDRDRPFARQL